MIKHEQTLISDKNKKKTPTDIDISAVKSKKILIIFAILLSSILCYYISVYNPYIKECFSIILDNQTIKYAFVLIITLCVIYRVYYYLTNFRENFVSIPFMILAYIQGKNFIEITTIDQMRKILKITDKGRGIEEMLAIPAFKPILNLESNNGPVWIKLKDNFMYFLPYLPDIELIKDIVVDEKTKLSKLDSHYITDGEMISTISLKVFLKYVFAVKNIENKSSNKRLIDQYNFDFISQYADDDVFMKELYDMSLEYRKALAARSEGDYSKKKKMVTNILEIIKSSHLKDVFDWDKPECFSIILQPFLVSPSINMSDVGVSLYFNKDLLIEFKKINNINDKDKIDSHEYWKWINISICKGHPFPVLERYESSTNTHYHINMLHLKQMLDDKNNRSDLILENTGTNTHNNKEETDSKTKLKYIFSPDYSSYNFGYGIRSCLGRHLAKQFILNYFSEDLILDESFKPTNNHPYSGRDNDNYVNLNESIYQLKLFILMFSQLIIERIVNWFKTLSN